VHGADFGATSRKRKPKQYPENIQAMRILGERAQFPCSLLECVCLAYLWDLVLSFAV
jgi:hypothetical protein